MTYRYRRYRRRSRIRPEQIIGLALGAFLVAGAGPKAVSAVHGGHGHLLSVTAPHGGTLDCHQLEQLWDAAGGNPSSAFLAAEVATAESSGQQYAYLADSNGTADMGYWQINTSHGSLATYDPYGNARAAVIISGNGTNWWPWVTYDNGLENGKC
jgi:hypothetical protein